MILEDSLLRIGVAPMGPGYLDLPREGSDAL